MRYLLPCLILMLAACGGGGGSDGASDETNLILGSREAPVSMGVEQFFTDNIGLTFVSVIQNANDVIETENQFNDPPQPGNQFFLARVRIHYDGPGVTDFEPAQDIAATGSRGVEYLNFRQSCGVTPDKCRDTQLFTGGVYECNMCWGVGSEEASGMLAYRRHSALILETGEPFFWALYPPG